MSRPTMVRANSLVERIQAVVAERFDLPAQRMCGPERVASIARPRMIAMWLARKLTGLSYPKIGRDFGWRHHTTVMDACRRVDAWRLGARVDFLEEDSTVIDVLLAKLQI